MKRFILFALILLVGLALAFHGASAAVATAGIGAAAEDSTAPPPQPGPGYLGIHWRTEPPFPCDGDQVSIAFEFCTCNITILRGGLDPAGPVRLHARINNGIVCVQCGPATFFVPIGQLAAGTHTVTIEITAEIIEADGTSRTEVTRHPFTFQVSPLCGGLPPPGALPFVTAIRIGRPSPCPECPPIACPYDSISVFIEGEFPDDCIWLKGVELLPSPIMGPMPEPPVLRILYGVNSCLGRPCALTPYPWTAFVKFPPLPPRSYSLLVEAARVDECFRNPPEIIGNASLPFVVVDSCAPPPSPDCFVASFANATPGGDCDAFVAPQQPVELTLGIASGTALAGVQGRLMMYPPGLRIARMEPVGVAGGMLLEWKPTEYGASFVLFARSGAPIPDTDLERFVPVLRVVVAPAPDAPIPERTELYTAQFLGSDSTGAAVYECPSVLLDRVAVIRGVTICRAAPCDLNGDGVADVRDLVLMVRCILGVGACADADSAKLDCDRDGGLDVDDVLCCARVVLRGGMPPDTAAGRPEPAIAVRMGEAARTATGVDLPVTLLGADRFGAARLEMAFPAGRYDVAGVDLAGAGSAWLNLHEVQAERLVIGLVGLADVTTEIASRVDLVVHLALKPGGTAGGEAMLVGTQFSGRDGVSLEVDAGRPSRPLGPPARVTLSPSTPNPFARETRFTVTLSAPGNLDVSIFDLQGRLVATLHRGPSEAGSLDFMWRRTRDDGSPARSGIYFYRAAVGGASATQKVVVMARE